MSTLTTSMLRSLLSTQSPSFSAGASAGSQSMGGANFAGLLSAARKGTVTSDRPVEATSEAAGKLTAEQLQRIAVAADHAESAGMNTALVLIDGQAVKLDVLGREVTGVMDPRTVAVTDIDGVLAAPPSSLSGEVSGGGAGPATAAGVLEQQLLAHLGSKSLAGVSPRVTALASSLR